MFADDEVDAVLALNCPTAQRLLGRRRGRRSRRSRPPPRTRRGRTCLPPGSARIGRSARPLFNAAASRFETPGGRGHRALAPRALSGNQALLMESPRLMPEADEADPGAAGIAMAAAGGGRPGSTRQKSRRADAYYIPRRNHASPPTRGGGASAAAIGFPVALKSARRDIMHKSDVGGDRARARRRCAVRTRRRRMLARVGTRMPRPVSTASCAADGRGHGGIDCSPALPTIRSSVR